MKAYLLRPLDTIFFRDGKPFTMGEDTLAGSLFPPLPSTLYGAMRTAYMSHKGSLDAFRKEEMKDQIGTPEEPGAFKIRALALYQQGEAYFPTPLDLVQNSKEKKNYAYPLSLKRQRSFVTDLEQSQLLMSTDLKEAESLEGTYLWATILKSYLRGSSSPDNTYKKYAYRGKEEFVTPEPKIGIGRDAASLTVKEGHLYGIGMQRLKDKTGFFIGYEGLDDFPDQALLKLGGEGKAVLASREDAGDLEFDLKPALGRIKETRRFKLYLATPTLFEKGWCPKEFTQQDGIWTWQKGSWKCRLLTAVIGKPMLVGGWDLARQKPKPMRKAVPAGSVYYFEIADGNPQEICTSLHQKNISELYPEQGFGYALIGVLP